MNKISEIVYYNEHAKEKLDSFYNVNRRLDGAWRTLNRFLPPRINNILEIGCGVGDMSYKMSRKWKKSTVTGIDLSDTAIKIANNLFGSDRIKYFAGSFNEIDFDKTFDLIVLFDVYEHIDPKDRTLFNDRLNRLLQPGGYLFMAIPAAAYQDYIKKFFPEKLQPVDESLTLEVFHSLASACNAELLFYKNVNIYYEGDYTHIVFRKKSEINRYEKTVTVNKPFLIRAFEKTFEYLLYKNPVFSRRVIRLLKTRRKLRQMKL